MNFSVQNKQNKKDFQQPQILALYDFLKLEVFPEENPTQKLPNSLGPRRNWQKIQSTFTEIVKILKKIIK